MTVSSSDFIAPIEPLPIQHESDRQQRVKIEPLLALEWAQAVELTGDLQRATSPADTRRAWIHQAPEFQVVGRYRVVRQFGSELTAPWWLRVLAMGGLSSRAAAFALEDTVHEFLMSRPGWVFVPWVTDGETGYWEFVPSEVTSTNQSPSVPTTVAFTHRHQGWLDVLPAHRGLVPARIPVRGSEDLAARIDVIEQL